MPGCELWADLSMFRATSDRSSLGWGSGHQEVCKKNWPVPGSTLTWFRLKASTQCLGSIFHASILAAVLIILAAWAQEIQLRSARSVHARAKDVRAVAATRGKGRHASTSATSGATTSKRQVLPKLMMVFLQDVPHLASFVTRRTNPTCWTTEQNPAPRLSPEDWSGAPVPEAPCCSTVWWSGKAAVAQSSWRVIGQPPSRHSP